MSRTTTHGVSHVTMTSSPARRLLWGILFTVALGALIVTASKQIHKYTRGQKTMTSSVVHEQLFTFPAVTVCRSYILSTKRVMQEAVDNIEKYKFKKFDNKAVAFIATVYENYMTKRDLTLSQISECKVSFGIGPYKPVEEPHCKRLLTRPDPTNRPACETFAFLQLDTNVDKIPNIHWKKALKEEIPISSFRYASFPIVGRRTPMVLLLQLNLDEYLMDLVPSKNLDDFGVLIAVHPPDTVALIKDFNFIPAGAVAEISVRNITTSRLSQAEGGSCIDYNSLTPEEKLKHYDTFASASNTSYTKENCLATCKQKYVMQHCGCSLPNIPTAKDFVRATVGRNDISDCSAFSADNLNFTSIDEFADNLYRAAIFSMTKCKLLYIKPIPEDFPCNCPEPCRSVEYDISLRYFGGNKLQPNSVTAMAAKLYSLFNNTGYGLERFLNVPDNVKNLTNATEYLQEYDILADPAKNSVIIKVYISSDIGQIVSENLIYTLTDMWSDLGGLAGLFLGVSIIGICEWVEFLIDLSKLIYITCKPRQECKNGDTKQNDSRW